VSEHTSLAEAFKASNVKCVTATSASYHAHYTNYYVFLRTYT